MWQGMNENLKKVASSSSGPWLGLSENLLRTTFSQLNLEQPTQYRTNQTGPRNYYHHEITLPVKNDWLLVKISRQCYFLGITSDYSGNPSLSTN